MTLLSPASPLGLLCGECPCLTGLTALAAEGSTCDWGGGAAQCHRLASPQDPDSHNTSSPATPYTAPTSTPPSLHLRAVRKEAWVLGPKEQAGCWLPCQTHLCWSPLPFLCIFNRRMLAWAFTVHSRLPSIVRVVFDPHYGLKEEVAYHFHFIGV